MNSAVPLQPWQQSRVQAPSARQLVSPKLLLHRGPAAAILRQTGVQIMAT